jgi:2-phosphoglycerate kinase
VIYFVGGPPRVGKSIVATEITRRRGISAVSTDSLGAVLEAVVDPEAVPGLFAVSRFNEMAEADRIELLVGNPSKRIDYQLDPR